MAFQYQKYRKLESEQRIINALSSEDKTFSQLLEITKLSKPILSKRLKDLQRKGKIQREQKNGKILYVLDFSKLNKTELTLLRIWKLQEKTLKDLERIARDNSFETREIVYRELTKLLMFKVLSVMDLEKPIREQILIHLYCAENAERIIRILSVIEK